MAIRPLAITGGGGAAAASFLHWVLSSGSEAPYSASPFTCECNAELLDTVELVGGLLGKFPPSFLLGILVGFSGACFVGAVAVASSVCFASGQPRRRYSSRSRHGSYPCRLSDGTLEE